MKLNAILIVAILIVITQAITLTDIKKLFKIWNLLYKILNRK
jgi:hypothetical protein